MTDHTTAAVDLDHPPQWSSFQPHLTAIDHCYQHTVPLLDMLLAEPLSFLQHNARNADGSPLSLALKNSHQCSTEFHADCFQNLVVSLQLPPSCRSAPQLDALALKHDLLSPDFDNTLQPIQSILDSLLERQHTG